MEAHSYINSKYHFLSHFFHVSKMGLTVVLLLLIIVGSILQSYWFFKKSYRFFDENHFPTLKPTFVFGNLGDAITFKKSLALTIYDLYNKLEAHKFAGLYMLHRPFVMIRDAELIKNILIKDFVYFRDRGIACKEDAEPLNNNLLRIDGDRWKSLRVKLTPIFSPNKMKLMFVPIQENSKKLVQILNSTKGESFDMKELSERFTTDVIGNCAFGIETRALENPDSIVREMGKRIFEFRYQTLIRHLFPHLPSILVKIFKLTYLNKIVESFFIKMLRETIEQREKSSVSRKDLLELLIALKNETSDIYPNKDVEQFLSQINDNNVKNETGLTMDLIIAQCYLFFAAGFETSSSSLGYVMLELALNKNVQNTARNEIIKVLSENGGEITYDSLKDMTYADMVIAETLRKHPPAGFLLRKCTKSYQIPDTEAIIPQNTLIFISIYGVHMDRKYYEKPEQFYPEHFEEEARNKRPKCAFIPFGDGPRNCIGERFAKLEIKIGMIHMLMNHSFDVSPQMKLPLEYNYDSTLGLMSVKGGIWLRCQKI
uniref:Cytochrome P450 6AED1 n=1 Tax=Maconellicoccus hirsutus TaxID=177089 RepID=A0AAT9UU66_MACHI